MLPTGDQEIISIGDTAADIALTTGFTAVSLDITEIDDFRRNFHLTLSIDSASRLKSGNITCDDTTTRKEAEAGCLISKLSSPSNCSLLIGDKMHVSVKILWVHLIYQGSSLCTTHFHKTLYYKGSSYVLYIRWTLIKNYIFYTKGPSYVNSLQANQTGTDQATPTYIRWTLIKVPALL